MSLSLRALIGCRAQSATFRNIVRSLETKGATLWAALGQGGDLLETQGRDDRPGGVIEV